MMAWGTCRHAPRSCPRTRLAATLLALPAFALAQFPHAPEGEKPYPPSRDGSKEVLPQRPGDRPPPMHWYPPPTDPKQVPAPEPLIRRESLAVSDRWRIMQSLGYRFPWYDPYNQNVLKGDIPLDHPVILQKLGTDWFLNAGLISDTVLEARRLPIPVAPQTSTSSPALDIFGKGRSHTFVQTLIPSLALIKGNTTFKPPDYEFRIVPAMQFNYSRFAESRVLRVDPRAGISRSDNHAGLQEFFADVHWRNVSPRYDFDSYRFGIQPFISDFRGFVFQDVPIGARLFGTRDNNRWQYNLGLFRRIEKDTNSGLNDINTRLRRDWIAVGNLYRQDFPWLGFTSQITVMHNANREGEGRAFYNANGFQERPAVFGDARGHNYRVTYLGYSGDGHIGRWNLTTSLYAALGKDRRNPLSGQPSTIRAQLAVAELSRDFSWIRTRFSALFASADSKPFDNRSTGFDAILENPQFAGADTSFWIRQAVPLIGGGGVALSGRNGVLASLRSSKDQGQSNFVNPGTALVGAGVDMDLTPRARTIVNINRISFVNTAVLGVLRNQTPPARSIGWDLSAALQYRPFMSQNVVLNVSAAALLPARATRQLFDEDRRGRQYSLLANLVLTF
jgi:hypothetical protein